MSLSANGIGVRVGPHTLLDDLSADYPAGQVTAIVGANGAGKTTLLGCLAGVRRPSAGTVRLNDENLADLDPLALARQRAYLPQEHLLSFPFTVAEVVVMGRAPHYQYYPTRQDHDIVERLLELCELGPLQQQIYMTLSGGEKQRTHLARVLAQIWGDAGLDGKFLLLDEPTNSLDIQHQLWLLSQARDWAARGLTIIAVLHDINLAARFADRVQILKAGVLIADGAPAEILTSANIEPAFGVRVERLTPHGADYSLLVPQDLP